MTRRRSDPLRELTEREREVLGSIFTKLALPRDDEQHRCVIAVLAYRRGRARAQ